jgi:hypothetical protein
MSDILSDLYAHQAWTDAEHWRTLESIRAALDDDSVCRRLHHIHLVQSAYLSIARGERIYRPTLESFASMAELKECARQHHAAAESFIAWHLKGKPAPAW